jgi:hypothetical protein
MQLVEEKVNDPATQGKVIHLNRTTDEVPNSNITLAGCTLHPRIEEGRLNHTNDFKCIEDWTVDKHNSEHTADLEWLKNELFSVGKKWRVVVATHYIRSDI